MGKELILSTEIETLLNEIKNTGKAWYEIPLPDLPIYPKFKRRLVVTGFTTPDMEGDEDRIYVNVRQYLILKDTGNVHKKIKMKDWMIHEGNVEEITGQNGLIKVPYVVKDEEGIVIEQGEEILKAQSVQYVRFLVKNKSMHIVDILERFMGIYIDLFKEEIDNV